MREICDAVPTLDYICIDVANGYSQFFIDFIRKVREEFPRYPPVSFVRFHCACMLFFLPRHTIMAGNVVTGEMVEELILTGADIVKVDILLFLLCSIIASFVQVGIGPGSVCTTRKKAGVGYPQLSATMECADAAHGLNGHVISDGGCTNPGDVAKAFGAGIARSARLTCANRGHC
ncbi:unnamed protein product [Heligmosomoides polygyrus]|uniref:GMP reductase n=1 Tax=Heligmosomoides polygyrus TaxID=6339 RepID=A0A3P7U4L1_HELPZ|nr:unnamed protein product [Heligmosomoides polygyrus]